MKTSWVNEKDWAFLAMGDNSLEGFTRLQNEYLKYRVSGNRAPTEVTQEQWLEYVTAYLDDPRVSSFSIGFP